MKIVADQITIAELKEMAAAMFGDMVKAVVDVEKGVMALSAELHSDLEALLLECGSKQKDLWGINVYPDMPVDEFVEFDSLINIRPSHGNRSRDVADPETRRKIITVVNRWIKR